MNVAVEGGVLIDREKEKEYKGGRARVLGQAGSEKEREKEGGRRDKEREKKHIRQARGKAGEKG